MKFERDKLYKARDGSVWRVVCVDGPCPEYPLIAARLVGMPNMDVFSFTVDGRFGEATHNGIDLITEHREPREWWLCTESLRAITLPPPDASKYRVVRVREVLE